MTYRKNNSPELIKNELRFLQVLSKTGYVPKVEGYGVDYIDMELLSIDGRCIDEVEFARNAARALKTLRVNKIVHGDLTYRNIIIRNDIPIVIDFAESRFSYENNVKDKRCEGDYYHFWRAISRFSPDTTRRLRRWICIRDNLVGQSIIDLGCFEGDFCGFAHSEGMNASGIDKDIFAIHRALDIWPGVAFSIGDITTSLYLNASNILLMDVFPYIVNQYGWEIASDLMFKCVNLSDALFFETQLFGDGPGPREFLNDSDVEKYLIQFGKKVESILTLTVPGRETFRTLWKIS